jgi:hypothetical protein
LGWRRSFHWWWCSVCAFSFGLDQQAQVQVVEIALLRSTPVFASLPAPAIEGVARSLRREEYKPGAVIIGQGDVGGHYYAIAEGTVEIRRDGDLVRELGRSSGMGEVALLHEVPRTASAVALTAVTVYSLARDSFPTSLQGHAPSYAAARAVAERTRAEGLQPARPTPGQQSRLAVPAKRDRCLALRGAARRNNHSNWQFRSLVLEAFSGGSKGSSNRRWSTC